MTQLRQVEGRHPVLELLRSGKTVTRLVWETGLRRDERLDEIWRLAGKAQVEQAKLSRKRLDKLSQTGVHQGIIAWTEPEEEISLKLLLAERRRQNQDIFLLILPNITYEHNLGAVIRTAHLAGADAVVVDNRGLTLTAVVSRVSMGAAEYLPLIHENIYSVIKWLKTEGIRLVAADIGGAKELYRTDLTGPLALVLGEEHKGLSQNLLSKMDLSVRIPNLGRIDSLNLSVAAGVIMFEIVRQRSSLS